MNSSRLYAKGPRDKRFSPVDWAAGQQVINLIFASVFNATETATLKRELPELHKENPGWAFELRALGAQK